MPGIPARDDEEIQPPAAQLIASAYQEACVERWDWPRAHHVGVSSRSCSSQRARSISHAQNLYL